MLSGLAHLTVGMAPGFCGEDTEGMSGPYANDHVLLRRPSTFQLQVESALTISFEPSLSPGGSQGTCFGPCLAEEEMRLRGVVTDQKSNCGIGTVIFLIRGNPTLHFLLSA